MKHWILLVVDRNRYLLNGLLPEYHRHHTHTWMIVTFSIFCVGNCCLELILTQCIQVVGLVAMWTSAVEAVMDRLSSADWNMSISAPNFVIPVPGEPHHIEVFTDPVSCFSQLTDSSPFAPTIVKSGAFHYSWLDSCCIVVVHWPTLSKH